MYITTVDRDIIEHHVLPRLDGVTLACVAGASPMLRALCTEEKLWKDVCTSAWPSVNDPRVRHVISSFPSGYRSFFSDSSTITTTFNLTHTSPPRHHHDHPSPASSELISAVDIRYKNKTIYSNVEVSDEFLSPPLCIDVLRIKETAPMPVPVNFKSDNNKFLSDLEESMSLSWILIDPTQKRSVNLSSQRPISVEQNYMTGEVQLLYVTVLPGNTGVGSSEPVQCRIMVTCGGKEGEEMHVREVNMELQDMDGLNLSGEGSLVILQGAMESQRTKQGKGREIYEKFCEMKRERRERIERRDHILDVISTIIRIFIFLIFVCGVLFCY